MPNKPAQIDPLADAILTRLAGFEEAGEIVLGGYFALQHYAPYRSTHDIDAWWKTSVVTGTMNLIRSTMTDVAADMVNVNLEHRQFGETNSFELKRVGRRFFSFQISIRSLGLDPPDASAWSPVWIETFNDNIGSKMNALVDRGSPRDFTDIKHVVDLNLITFSGCWDLWQAKNPGLSQVEARQKILFHLTSLETRRPLDNIPNLDERSRARQLRTWYHRLLTDPNP